MLTKECFVSIKKSIKKFISLLLIVLLGVGFYAGIKATSPDMKDTLDTYYQKTNIYDIELISTLGITEENIETLKQKGYQMEGTYSFDTVIKAEEEHVAKILSYNKESTMNKIILKEGTLPKSDKECLIEKNDNTTNYKIGDKITVNNDNLKNKELTIVGIIESPIYISTERGTTNLLSGKIDYYIYIPITNFNTDYYTNAYINLKTDESVFSDNYKDLVKEEKEKLETITKQLAKQRKEELTSDAKEKIKEAEKQYEIEEKQAQSYLQNPYVPEQTKQEITTQLEQAKQQIETAKEQLKTLEEPEWYILDLESNIGFYQYQQDTDRIDNIAKVFPLVFFIVAILICLTTMTRMVEEERNQIGTLKSIGYGDKAIMFKYLLYAFTATVFGSIIGVLIGFQVIPSIIFKMYGMMYNIPDFQSNFHLNLTLEGTIIATICTLGATLFACIKTLKEVPAELLRPQAPKAGKRVLLERITPIWKHLKFSHKVTVRNVFRYKKKFLMTIIGISGCTGLILAGFGLKDCITNMVPNQYEKIFNYQVSVTLKDDITEEERKKTYEQIEKIEEVNQSLKIRQETIELTSHETNQTIQLIIPYGDISDFIKLQDRKSQEKYQLKDQIIISEKLANLLAIKKDDTLEFQTENENYQLKIGEITENYLYHYIYIGEDQAKNKQYNTILLKTDKMNEQQEKELSNKIKELDTVSSLSFNSSSRSMFDHTMKNFGYVALVLIISAGLLAFVVLYNLESINISERKREIASLKVLGFDDKEVYNYIARETIILSSIGITFGMLVGKILTNFIMKTCELDMTMFDPKISLESYLYSIGITIIFLLLVNITTYFTLKKIDMIESLKSVE